MILKRVPYLTLLVLAISLLGILFLYSTTHIRGEFTNKNIFYRQLLWLSIGYFLFVVISYINYQHLKDLSFLLYIGSIVLLLLVEFIGRSHLGAQRWLKIGNINFQPSEFTKLTVILYLSYYFSKRPPYRLLSPYYYGGLTSSLFIPFLIVSIPILLILRQPDLGTATVIIFVFVMSLITTGIKTKYIFLLGGIFLLALPFLWHSLKEYQKIRIMAFFDPNIDPLGVGYTVIQSKIAIGSGKLLGKGWLSGTQNQLNFLPERHTDFIFSVIGEEWGFLGSVVFIFLYYLLIYEGIKIANSCKDSFGKFLCCGIVSMIFFQVAVNILMSMGMMPVVGLPLPLISYGGSSLITTFASLGILISIKKWKPRF